MNCAYELGVVEGMKKVANVVVMTNPDTGKEIGIVAMDPGFVKSEIKALEAKGYGINHKKTTYKPVLKSSVERMRETHRFNRSPLGQEWVKKKIEKKKHDPRLYSNLRGMLTLESRKKRVDAHKQLSRGLAPSKWDAFKEGFFRKKREKKS